MISDQPTEAEVKALLASLPERESDFMRAVCRAAALIEMATKQYVFDGPRELELEVEVTVDP